MSIPDIIVENKIREHEARLKHIDELMAKAESVAKSDAMLNHGLADLKRERERINNYIDGLKQKFPEEFMKTAGPMVMWEILAEKLEHLLEGNKAAGS